MDDFSSASADGKKTVVTTMSSQEDAPSPEVIERAIVVSFLFDYFFFK